MQYEPDLLYKYLNNDGSVLMGKGSWPLLLPPNPVGLNIVRLIVARYGPSFPLVVPRQKASHLPPTTILDRVYGLTTSAPAESVRYIVAHAAPPSRRRAAGRCHRRGRHYVSSPYYPTSKGGLTTNLRNPLHPLLTYHHSGRVLQSPRRGLSILLLRTEGFGLLSSLGAWRERGD